VNLALTVLEIVAPVLVLALIGFTWVKVGFDYPIAFVTRLGTGLAVPCLIFVSLMQTDIDARALVNLSLATLVAYALIGVVFAVLLRSFGLDRRTFLAPAIFGNTGNLGLPLALFAFGDRGLSLALVVFAVSSILAFTVGVWLVAGRGSGGKALREPMVWATVFGALFASQGWQTPQFVTDALGLIGQMAIPLMLITLGVALARIVPGQLALSATLALVKVVICFAIAWGVALMFGLQGEAFGVLVLLMSTPVAVVSYLLAEKYGADSQAVAGMVMVSTVISIAALPLVLAIVLWQL